MSRQNIYDDDIFFQSYKELRAEVNANEVVEMPAILKMLPSLNGLSILDLGCGYGEHCIKYIEMGADKVMGIDISEKMLEIAVKQNHSPKVTYQKLAVEDILKLDECFDLVISSLTLHYIDDFKKVAEDVYRLLNNGRSFIFSQEHPLNTCFNYGNRWTKDEFENKIHANVSNYSIDGRRESRWFKDGIIKYHRTFETILNTLIETGFIVEQISEPIPSDEIMEKYPGYKDNIHKPDFLLIKVKKQVVSY